MRRRMESFSSRNGITRKEEKAPEEIFLAEIYAVPVNSEKKKKEREDR